MFFVDILRYDIPYITFVDVDVGTRAINHIYNNYRCRCSIYISGWWLTYPSETYEFVSWDDDIPN